MSDDPIETTPALPAPAASVAPASARPAVPRSRGGGTALLIALLALGLAAYAAWRIRLQETTHADDVDPRTLAAQVQTLTHTVEQLRSNADSVHARLDDTAKVDQSEREELLGLGERARLLEDAVANLADKRLSGHDALALDEAELLLNLGAERLNLFHDADAAITAYRLADTALSEVEDAAFSTVRQSIGAEIEALQGLHGVDNAQLLGKLGQARAQALALPATPRLATSNDAPADDSRLWHVLGALVRVRHGEDAQAQLARRDAGLVRELTALDLREAESALLARDDARYHAALASAQAQLAAFDRNAEPVVALSAGLAALDQAKLAPPPPALLGTALKELRNLRTTHALRAPARHAAAKADDTHKADEAQK